MSNLSYKNFSSIEFQTKLGERLRSERKRLGLTQSQAAEIGDITRATQSLYESGDGNPSIEYLTRLSMAGFDWKFIFNGGMSTEYARELSKDELLKAYRMTDKLGRDHEGRLLELQTREDIFQRLSHEMWASDGILNETIIEKKIRKAR